ncbi:peptidase, M50 family [Clostridiales bacterium oral taxon 876 str. F0540]|nr:peptidase, M50 family [Clostridiales bacterium oral taxon 876 str. F0540]
MKIISFYFIFMISLFIHELGHYYVGKLFRVKALKLSIGAGPSFIDTYIGPTQFSIKFFPLMGLVEHDAHDIDNLSLFKNILILLAGVFNNLILSMFAILVLCKFNFILMLNVMFTRLIPSVFNIFADIKNFLGANGSISHAYTSIPVSNLQEIWSLCAVINIGLVFGNLLPIPGLDGGQVILFTIQRTLERFGLKRDVFNKIANRLIWICLTLLIFLPVINEILASKNPLLYAICTFIGVLLAILFYVISKTEIYKRNFKRS